MYRPTGSYNSANFGRSVILSIGDNLFFYLYGCLNIKDYTQERKNLQYTEDLKYIKFIEKKKVVSIYALPYIRNGQIYQ